MSYRAKCRQKSGDKTMKSFSNKNKSKKSTKRTAEVIKLIHKN